MRRCIWDSLILVLHLISNAILKQPSILLIEKQVLNQPPVDVTTPFTITTYNGIDKLLLFLYANTTGKSSIVSLVQQSQDSDYIGRYQFTFIIFSLYDHRSGFQFDGGPQLFTIFKSPVKESGVI